MVPTLYHFSDFGDISEFRPRAPLQHPAAEPVVYAIDAWHSPLYLFPRACPRIGIWPIADTSAEDAERFRQQTSARMLLFIDASFETGWREGTLFRYEMDSQDGFIDTGDHGVWISRQTVVPLDLVRLTDLPAELDRADLEVRAVSSLTDLAKTFYDFEGERFLTTLHVSMIRTSNIANWPKPVVKETYCPASSQDQLDRIDAIRNR
jgi:hypothetical protein